MVIFYTALVVMTCVFWYMLLVHIANKFITIFVKIFVKINYNLSQIHEKIDKHTSCTCGYLGAAEQNITDAIRSKSDDR